MQIQAVVSRRSRVTGYTRIHNILHRVNTLWGESPGSRKKHGSTPGAHRRLICTKSASRRLTLPLMEAWISAPTVPGRGRASSWPLLMTSPGLTSGIAGPPNCPRAILTVPGASARSLKAGFSSHPRMPNRCLILLRGMRRRSRSGCTGRGVKGGNSILCRASCFLNSW